MRAITIACLLVLALLRPPPVVTVQVARPIATLSSVCWESSDPGLDLHECVDEAVPNDSGDYIECEEWGGASVYFALSEMLDPGVDTGHKVRVRLRTGASNEPWQFTLLQGSNNIHTAVYYSQGTDWETYEYTIPALYVAQITDYTDLNIRIGKGNSAVPYRCSTVQFEAPLPGGGV